LYIFTGWAVDPNGTIARFVNHDQYEIHDRHPRRHQKPAALGVADSMKKVYSLTFFGFCLGRKFFCGGCHAKSFKLQS